jgi:hypothetical protein
MLPGFNCLRIDRELRMGEKRFKSGLDMRVCERLACCEEEADGSENVPPIIQTGGDGVACGEVLMRGTRR